jgi:hypothetical protein
LTGAAGFLYALIFLHKKIGEKRLESKLGDPILDTLKETIGKTALKIISDC